MIITRFITRRIITLLFYPNPYIIVKLLKQILTSVMLDANT